MKKALLVGINRYPFMTGADLSGCIPDVKLDDHVLYGRRDKFDGIRKFNKLSGYYGFEEPRMLIDGAATRAAVLDSLNWLLDGAKAGDDLVWIYSGHGTQVRDRNGDEPDRLDEALCCSDTTLRGNKGLLVDDDIYKVFRKLPKGAYLTVIADACTFASGTRSIPLTTPRRVVNPNAVGVPTRRLLRAHDKDQRHILLSGCQDGLTSADAWFGEHAHGALHFAMWSALLDNPDLTWTSLHKKVTSWLENNGYEQRPQLSGMAVLQDRRVFGGKGRK